MSLFSAFSNHCTIRLLKTCLLLRSLTTTEDIPAFAMYVHISSLFTDYSRIQILSEVFTLSLISHYITGFNCNYRIHYNAEESLNHCFMSTFSTIYVTDSVHISYFMRSHECTRVHLMFLDGQIVSKASGTIKFLAHQGLKRRTFQQAGSLSFQKSTKRTY